MRRVTTALMLLLTILGGLSVSTDFAFAQYYERGYRPYYERGHRPPPPRYGDPYRRSYGRPAIQCPHPLVPDTDRYSGRQYCREWVPQRGSECPPGLTLQSGFCKPYRGP